MLQFDSVDTDNIGLMQRFGLILGGSSSLMLGWVAFLPCSSLPGPTQELTGNSGSFARTAATGLCKYRFASARPRVVTYIVRHSGSLARCGIGRAVQGGLSSWVKNMCRPLAYCDMLYVPPTRLYM